MPLQISVAIAHFVAIGFAINSKP